MTPRRARVLVLDDRVLPVLVGRYAAVGGMRCRYSEPRPGVPIHKGGGHCMGEELLGQLGSRDRRWHAPTVVFCRVRWAVRAVRHPGDGIGTFAPDRLEYARSRGRPARACEPPAENPRV